MGRDGAWAMIHLARLRRGSRPVLGLHGWGGNNSVFGPLASSLEKPTSDIDLWAVDLPGYGRSPAITDWTIHSWTEELLLVVDEILNQTGRRPLVIGNCSGAIVAAALALRVELEGLLLLDPFAYMPWYFRLFLWGEFGRRAYRTTFATSLGRRLTNQAMARHRTEDSDLTSSFVDVDHEVAYRFLELLAEVVPEDFGDLGETGLPIHVIHGARTFRAVRESLPRWQQVWPQMTTAEIAGAGHLPLEEAPAEVAVELQGLIARSSSQPDPRSPRLHVG